MAIPCYCPCATPKNIIIQIATINLLFYVWFGALILPQGQYGGNGLLLVLEAIGVTFNIFLLIGLNLDNTRTIFSWILWSYIEISVYGCEIIVLLCSYMKDSGTNEALCITIGFLFSVIGLKIYSVTVVEDFYKKLKNNGYVHIIATV